MFDIDMPEDAAEIFPAGKADAAPRRGPMATAITETAESSRDRALIEAQIRAENDALAQEHVRLKRAGLITDMIQLDAIDTTKLMRDRAPGADFELAELVESIRDIGLSNPIQSSRRGRYELIQGFRRSMAYRQLLKDSGDADRWGASRRASRPKATRWISCTGAWSMKTWCARISALPRWHSWPCITPWTRRPTNTTPTRRWRCCSNRPAIRSAAISASSSR